MAVSITIEITRSFTVKADIGTTFALLANVPESGAHFPKVDKLEEIAPNTFRWELRKTGIDNYAIQTIYACEYESDPKAHTVTWTPLKGVGNSVVQGAWHMKPAADGGTECHFRTHGDIELPVPRLLKMAVAPIVKHEFNALVDQYVNSLKSALSE